MVNVQTIATNELYCYLSDQADAIAPEPPVLLDGITDLHQGAKPLSIRTPQRKARYHDKQRTKKSFAKRKAMLATQISSTKEVKFWLKKLGVKLDLRLSSAWVAIWKELATKIKMLRVSFTCPATKPPLEIQRRAKETFGHRQRTESLTGYTLPLVLAIEPEEKNCSNPLNIKVGDKVIWNYSSPRMSYIQQWFPLQVFSIDGDEVQLELLSFKVKLSELAIA